MQTRLHLVGSAAMLTVLVLSLHAPADAQRRSGGRGDSWRGGGHSMRSGGDFGMRGMSRGDRGRNFSSSRAGSGLRSVGSWEGINHLTSTYDRDRHYSRDSSRRYHHDWDRRSHRRYSRGWDDDSYYISIGLGGGYPRYSSSYSYPYYSAPYYGYGYTSPYAYYGYPYSPHSGYSFYTGYSSYYTPGYYW